jgi:hypothetical protein
MVFAISIVHLSRRDKPRHPTSCVRWIMQKQDSKAKGVSLSKLRLPRLKREIDPTHGAAGLLRPPVAGPPEAACLIQPSR